jgi:hypothetical protein
VPYTATLAVLLAAPLAIRNARFGRALVLFAVLVAVAGLTQTPLDYPVIYLFWALLGAGLQSAVASRGSVAAGFRETGAIAAMRLDGDGVAVTHRPPGTIG